MSKPPEDTIILVLDDDPAVLGAIADLLELADYQVDKTTQDGEYIENALQNNRPDLIILDILLSGYDGRDICKNLKSREDTRQIPIILISAHPEARNTAIAAGADDFIAKPFNIDDLLNAVAHHLQTPPFAT